MLNKTILSIVFLIIAQLTFGQVTIKMKKHGGVHEIPCKVNGQKLSFIFDTGASSVSISLTEARYMIKNNFLSKDDIIGSQSFLTADGSISEGTRIILKEIEIAGMVLKNVEASIVHELNAPLLLGQSAIERLGKIQLDLANNTLIILNPKAKGQYDYSNQEFDREKYTNSSKSSKNMNPYSIDFSKQQEVRVYTCAHILEKPDIISGKIIGFAENNTVQILSRIDEKIYKVKYGSITGFMWAGFFDL